MSPFAACAGRTWRIATGVLLWSLLSHPCPAAATQQVTIGVDVRVLKHASITVLAQPSAIVVTTADVARGFVELPSAAQMEIKTNSTAGYLLDISGDAGALMSHMVVTGLGQDVQMPPQGGFVTQQVARSGKSTVTFGFRILLSAMAREGTYSWPLRIAVVPR